VCAQAARQPKTIATGLVGNGNTLDHSPRWPHEGRGHSHCRALRTVADRLLSVACTVLEQQTLFDPTTRLGTLPAREHPRPIPLFDR